MKSIVNLSRTGLINLGKMLPFVLCIAVAVSYMENIHAILSENYILWNNEFHLYKPISAAIGHYLEYNAQMLALVVIISVSVKTCTYNKLACAYLAFNLYEKYFFLNHEYDAEIYVIVCLINIWVCYWLVKNGIKNYFKAI